MSSAGSVTHWISRLKAGDHAAAQPLWEAYFRRLVDLARARLRGRPRRAADEEDVAQSAFASFCRAAEGGRFPRLHDRHDLWQLLVLLTDRKAAHLVRDERRHRRGGGKVLDEAIQANRRALGLDPTFSRAHTNLGAALQALGLQDDAIGEYRTAIALDPKLALAHNNLGNALAGKGRLDDAIPEYRRAIALDPKLALAHYNLGIALSDQGQLDDAIREYRRVLALDPKHAKAHGAIGVAFLKRGRFAEAQASTRRCLDLLPPHHPLRRPVAEQLRQCDRFLALDQKLPALLQGQAKPAGAAERLDLAQLCRQYKQLYAASARFYAEAFADQPRLAEGLQAGHRYNAACAAALAAAGQGQDADRLDDPGRARLRRQALSWLRADLAAWARVVDKAPPQARPAVRQTLQHWQQDPDLAGLRDKDAVAKLPEAERQAWRKLWADVDALLTRARD
jgi:Tfp pilus assembly protein PilF